MEILNLFKNIFLSLFEIDLVKFLILPISALCCLIKLFYSICGIWKNEN